MTQIVLQERTTRALSAKLSLALLGCVLALGARAQQFDATQAQHLPTIQLGAGMHIIKAEVARTPSEHAIGLMFRTSMGNNEGMIFGFPRAEKQCFWMKNTLIPLSVAFVADDGRIVNLDEMLPQTENSHCSAEPVHFVLEMNKGWFTKHGIKPGDKLTGTPFESK